MTRTRAEAAVRVNVAKPLKTPATRVDVLGAAPNRRVIHPAMDTDTESRDQHMMARVRTTMQKRAEGEKGFTLIELLVVIIIIGILAAIAIPAFLNQRTRGWVAQVESDLKNAAIAAETYAVGNNGSYADLTLPLLEANGYNRTESVTMNAPAATATEFTLTAEHADLDGTWTYTSEDGVISDGSGTP